MLKGYNDMNTHVPNPFAVNDKVTLSGAGRCPTCEKKMMDGAGFLDDVKKGYSKAKGAVKSKTGQKIVGALKEDKSVMKELNKAKKQLKDYQDGVRKTKPGKAAMDILEQSGVISKIEDEFKGAGNKSGKINRLKKAKRWTGYANDTAYDGIDLADYAYRKAKAAANPLQDEATKAISGIGKMFGGAKSSSPWITHVKAFSQKNNMSYKDSLKAAGPSYRAIKNKM